MVKRLMVFLSNQNSHIYYHFYGNLEKRSKVKVKKIKDEERKIKAI